MKFSSHEPKPSTTLTVFDLELELVEEKYNPKTNQIEWRPAKSNSNDVDTTRANGAANDDSKKNKKSKKRSKSKVSGHRSETSGSLSMLARETVIRTTTSHEKEQISRHSSIAGYESDVTHRSNHLRHQIGGFSIKLRKSDNILTKCCPRFAKCITNDKVMIILTVVSITIGEIIDYGINDNFLHSKGLSALIKLYGSSMTFVFICYMNTFIIKQALQTFIVWYKCLYIALGICARMIYLGFYVLDTGDLHENNIDTTNNTISRLEYNINGGLLITEFLLWMFLGTIADGYVSPNNVKSNIARRTVMVVAIMILIWHYVELLFHLTSKNYDKQETITVHLFGKDETLYWRNIAMSSFFTAIMFVIAQLYRNIKHPTRLNFLPVLVKIEQSSLKLMSYDNASSNLDHWNHAANSINFTPKSNANGVIETNAFSVTIPCERTIFYIVLQRIFKMETNAQCIEYSEFLMRNKHCKRIYKVLSLLMFMTIVFYIISMEMVRYMNGHSFLGSSVGAVAISCNLFIILCLFSFFLNYNYTLVYYKHRSWTMIWKCYDITMFLISIYLIQWKYNWSQFSTEFSVAESIVVSILSVICWIMATFCLTMHQAYFGIAKCFKILLVLFYLGIINYYTVLFYLNDWEYTLNIFSLKISCRSLLLSHGLDLSIWFIHQLCRIIKDPTAIHLVAKVQIQWID